MLRIVSEGILDVREKFCACLTDWKKAFDRVKQFKLMQIKKDFVSTGAKEDLSANCAWIRVLYLGWTKRRQEV